MRLEWTRLALWAGEWLKLKTDLSLNDENMTSQSHVPHMHTGSESILKNTHTHTMQTHKHQQNQHVHTVFFIQQLKLQMLFQISFLITYSATAIFKNTIWYTVVCECCARIPSCTPVSIQSVYVVRVCAVLRCGLCGESWPRWNLNSSQKHK